MSQKKHLAFPNKADSVRLAIGVMGIGTSGPLIAMSAMPVLTLIFWRNLGGAIATFFMNYKRLELRDREGFKWSAIAGVVLAAHFVGFFLAMRYTSVAAGTALAALQPIFATIFAVITGHHVSRTSWFGMLVSFVGVLFISGVDLHFSWRAFQGDLAAIICAALAATYVNLGAKAQRSIPATTYTTICYFFCALTALPFALIQGDFFNFTAREWWIVLGLIVGAQLLGHSMFNSVLKRVSPAIVSMVVFFEVPISALLAIWWLGQKPHIGIWFGVLTILAGSALVVLGRTDEN
jgi:drug/metabolite transporter (DMT)-like permease